MSIIDVVKKMIKKPSVNEGEDNEVLKRVNSDFQYAAEKKEQDTFDMDARGSERETNFASQKRLRIYKLWYDSVQWLVDKDGNAFDATSYIATPTINFIQTIINQRVNSFKRRKVYMDVLPVGLGKGNLSLGWQHILKYIWKQEDFSGKMSLSYKDSLIMCSGWFKLMWNEEDKNIDIVPITPLDVYPDPYAKTLSDMRYIHLVFNKSKEYIEDKYKVKVSGNNPNDSVIIYESWYRKIAFGSPVCITWTEGQILDIKDVNKITGSDDFPIFTITPYKSSDKLWGSSLVGYLIDPQNLHNKSLGLLLDGMLVTNNGRVYTTDPDIQFSNDPREIIKVSAKEMIGTLNLNAADARWLSVVQYSGYGLMQELSETYAINAGGGNAQRTASGTIATQQAGNLATESDTIEIAKDMNRFGKVLVKMIKKEYTKKDLGEILGTKFENAEELVNGLDGKFDLFFDLSDPLPEDKMARNNLLAGLLAQNKIDLATFAKLTENTQLLEILQEQKAITIPGGQPITPTTPETKQEQVLSEAGARKEGIANKVAEQVGTGVGV